MSTFPSVNPLWDFNLPADSLATLPDDDFLAILHSQIAEANNNNNNPPSQGFQSYYVPQQPLPQGNNNDTNGKTVTHLPTTNTPPSLSDSTPSPPSGFESNLVDESTPRTDSEVNGWLNVNNEDPRKRKASFATEPSDNDQAHPSQRTHLTDPSSLPKAPSRRKSSGNHAADEQRLLKRKEQNRAAQRAFRERKEKHVKDLEEQLAAMASRNESTQAENDNLREMLRRLQAENTLLKQAAFTFSVPSGASFNSAESATSPSSSINTAANNSGNRRVGNISPGASSTQSTQKPGSTEDQARSPDGNNQIFYGNNPEWMLPNTGIGGAFPSPFTIISSNPTYMSYRDPAPSAAPFASFTNSFSMSSPRDSSMQAFSPQQQAYQSFLSPDVVMNDFRVGSTPLDSANYTFSTSGNENINLEDLYPGQIRSDSSTTSYGLDSSPGTGAQSIDKSTFKESNGCPQEAIAREIANRGQSMFVNETFKNKLAGRQIPSIPKSDANIDAETAYHTLRTHPQFKDLDISNLCQDFAEKVRCDGSKVVLPPNGMQELMDLLRSRVAQT